ncbi:hypothetical protein D9M70_512670 [compost metagenome]
MRCIEAGQHDIGDVVAVAALVVCGRRMRGEVAGDDADRAERFQLAGGAQHVELSRHIEPVTGLDFDRRNTFGKKRVEPWQSAFHELVDAQRIGRFHRGNDATAGPCDLFIGGAFEPHLELAGAVAAVHEMRMAIDEGRRQDAAFAVNRFEAACEVGRQIAIGTRKSDPPIDDSNGRILDKPKSFGGFAQRHKARVAPNAGCLLAGRDIVHEVASTGYNVYTY